LFEVGNVGSDAKGVASGVFDFQMRQVQLSLAARKQRDAIPGGREPERQTFSDTSPGSSYEHTGIGQRIHRGRFLQFNFPNSS
jgi:hypothetical protein